jgi:hypothetical protein
MEILEDRAEAYGELLKESIALLQDLREGDVSAKNAKQRLDILALSFELLSLQADIHRKLEAAQTKPPRKR